MRAYQKERFLNAVCFFATEHSRRTGRPAFQTYIYKYLALFDFAMLEAEGQPALDIKYRAMEMGPVPEDLYSKKEATSHYEFLRVCGDGGELRYVINPITEPDLDYFSAVEVATMRSILDEFARPQVSTKALIKATHDRIAAWRRAWRQRGGLAAVPMSYDDTFAGARRKSESSERFQTYKALQHASGRCTPLERV
jgi:uncharacterized phage-associated protein